MTRTQTHRLQMKRQLMLILILSLSTLNPANGLISAVYQPIWACKHFPRSLKVIHTGGQYILYSFNACMQICECVCV